MGEKKRYLAIRIPIKMHKTIKEIADTEEEWTVSSVIRSLLRKQLKEK